MQDNLDVYSWFRVMRESNPVVYNQDHHMWSVFRYNDVQRILSDNATFSSQFMGGGGPFGSSLISTDPPRHRQLRSLVTQAFTPRTVAQLAPRISTIVHELLDKVASRGEMDVIDDLAYPLPVTVIAEMLGIPPEDRERFKHWSDEMVGATHTPGSNAQAEMGAYFKRMIELRRREPKNDLISNLLTAQIEDEHLSMVEMLGFCMLLLVAGNETTTHLIGNAILCFSEQAGVNGAA